MNFWQQVLWHLQGGWYRPERQLREAEDALLLRRIDETPADPPASVCVETDPSHGRGGQEWCSTHGQLLSRCRTVGFRNDLEAARTAETLRGYRSWVGDYDSALETARKLVEDAFFLRQYGERPPGADPRRPETETWGDWERRAEIWLRGTLGGNAGEAGPKITRAEAVELIALEVHKDCVRRWEVEFRKEEMHSYTTHMVDAGIAVGVLWPRLGGGPE